MYKILKGQLEAVNPRKTDSTIDKCKRYYRSNQKSYILERQTIQYSNVQDTKGAIRSHKS